MTVVEAIRLLLDEATGQRAPFPVPYEDREWSEAVTKVELLLQWYGPTLDRLFQVTGWGDDPFVKYCEPVPDEVEVIVGTVAERLSDPQLCGRMIRRKKPFRMEADEFERRRKDGKDL